MAMQMAVSMAQFGPAGIPDSFPGKSAAEMPRWLREQGLDCMEYECGRGVRITEAAARSLGENARREGISLSLHSPYFINPANPQPESLEKNTKYILDSCRAAVWMGADRVVVHAGALLKRTRREALDTALETFRHILRVMDDTGYGHIHLCPETMGRINQLGDLEEVLEICSLDDRLLPTIDFGHLYARSLGADNGPEAMERILNRMEEVLGRERASQFHSHFSHIEYTQNGGEKCHKTFQDSAGFGPDWAPLAEAIVRRGWTPVFICESAGTQAEDALVLKQAYSACRSAAACPD